MQKILALFLFTLTLPFYPIFFLAIKLTSPGPFIFKQKRAGRGKKPFTIYKFRTMVKNAEELKKKYLGLNEAGDPTFKIINDPRFTKFGKILAKSALDELPQLINVIKGEMALVGPRPLPINEAGKVPKKYQGRFSVLPGLTSTWIIRGAHELSFEKWMELDLEYVKNKNALLDLKIIAKTILLLLRPKLIYIFPIVLLVIIIILLLINSSIKTAPVFLYPQL